MRASTRKALVVAGCLVVATCGGDDSVPPGDAGDDTSTPGDDGSGGGAGGDSGPTNVGDSVVEHHRRATRDGVYVQPGLTKAAAATLQRDMAFDGTVDGQVYAQPLYVENGPGGAAAFLVVTEKNNVHALDATTGAPLWTKNVGPAADIPGLNPANCGNVRPLGITGTPYLDLGRRTIYVGAVIGTGNAGARTIERHQIHALSLDDGSERAGWPVDPSGLQSGSVTFNVAPYQNQRGALTAVGGTLYVPYGGHAGDCGNYHGWIVAVLQDDPTQVKAWATPARWGGIWAVGGVVSDGTDIFAATGNTSGATTWGGGEAIVRLRAGAVFSADAKDYFAPNNWRDLDATDLDLGGTGPLLVDVPGATPSKLVVALGKDGIIYLLDRNHLGGVGTAAANGVAQATIVNGAIINAASAVTTAAGTFVTLHGHMGRVGTNCPAGQAGDLVTVKITASSPPAIETAWCRPSQGQGSPAVTTTDGRADAIVWTNGAEASNRLHGWDVETGEPVYPPAGGDAGAGQAMTGLRRFSTPIAVHDRLVTAGDNKLYVFKLP
ncbi:MAG TPA: hypothetical protein VK540_31880 [Polyangiaceae bacterium]|nr:hypothetical protein [Polyangiaceae bacterium]